MTNKHGKKQSIIHSCDRCLAKRGSGDRCTRRRREGHKFCGTHCKSTPNGIVSSTAEDLEGWEKLQVYVEHSRGIPYFVDRDGWAYHYADILRRIHNPRKIGKLTDSAEGKVFTIIL